MPKIVMHKMSQNDKDLDIETLGEPGKGGAYSSYVVTLRTEYPNDAPGEEKVYLDFQDGPVPEVGVTGLTNEALLAIIIHRLDCFQSGKFPCKENELALNAAEEALAWLRSRTRKRRAAGIEGKYVA